MLAIYHSCVFPWLKQTNSLIKVTGYHVFDEEVIDTGLLLLIISTKTGMIIILFFFLLFFLFGVIDHEGAQYVIG